MRLFSHTRTTSGSPTERAGELLDAYGNNILRLAMSYTRNRADAEDVLQETLVRYLVAKPKLAGADHEKAWLLRVAANLAKNRARDNAAHAVEELNEELVADDLADELIACEKDDAAKLWRAVGKLPETQREVVHLFYEEGLSTREIARIVGRADATVRSDLHRAREALRKMLGEGHDLGQ